LTPLARRKPAQVIIRGTPRGSEEPTRHLTADRRCRERSVNVGYIWMIVATNSVWWKFMIGGS